MHKTILNKHRFREDDWCKPYVWLPVLDFLSQKQKTRGIFTSASIQRCNTYSCVSGEMHLSAEKMAMVHFLIKTP